MNLHFQRTINFSSFERIYKMHWLVRCFWKCKLSIFSCDTQITHSTKWWKRGTAVFKLWFKDEVGLLLMAQNGLKFSVQFSSETWIRNSIARDILLSFFFFFFSKADTMSWGTNDIFVTCFSKKYNKETVWKLPFQPCVAVQHRPCVFKEVESAFWLHLTLLFHGAPLSSSVTVNNDVTLDLASFQL